MTKEKKILINYLLYILLFIGICIVGISNVFADSTNIGYISNDTQVLLGIPNAGAPVTLNQNATATTSNVTQIWFNINYNFEKDKLYQLEISTPNANFVNVNTFAIEYNGGVCNFYGYSDANIGFPKLYFKCPINVSYLSISFKNWDDSTIISGSNFKWSYTYLRSYTDDEEIDLGPVISNQTQNTQDIINNNDTNTQDIINNNNSNTDRLIEDNKKNFETCKNSTNLIDYSMINTANLQENGYYLIAFINGKQILNGTFKENTQYTLSFKAYSPNNTNAGRFIFYYTDGTNKGITINSSSSKDYVLISDKNKTISYIGLTYGSVSNTYIKDLMLNEGSNATEYEPYGEEICTNKLDEQNKTSKGILAKLGDLFNTLFSNEDADVSGLDNMVGWLPPGPVDSIINLPLSLFNSLTNTLSGTCSPVTLTLPFVNQNLTLPCFDTYMTQYVSGFNTLWTLIGFISSIFILYYYLLALYKWVDDTLTMRENNLPGYYDDNWGGGA